MTHPTAAPTGLTAIAGHYHDHPDLPAWASITPSPNYSFQTWNSDLKLLLNGDKQPARDLLDWADSLDEVTVTAQSYGDPQRDSAFVRIYGTTSDGTRLNVWNSVPYAAWYLAMPDNTEREIPLAALAELAMLDTDQPRRVVAA